MNIDESEEYCTNCGEIMEDDECISHEGYCESCHEEGEIAREEQWNSLSNAQKNTIIGVNFFRNYET